MEKYLDTLTEKLHTTKLTKKLTGKYYREKRDCLKAGEEEKSLELKYGEVQQLQKRSNFFNLKKYLQFF